MTDPRRGFFEGLAGDWDGYQPENRLAHLDNLVKNIVPDLSQCIKTLNIGSGTGVLPSILTSNYPGMAVVSIDFAYSMLSLNHQLDKYAQLIQADVHDLPFVRNRFDVVICHNSFPHFSNHPAALKEMIRVVNIDCMVVILHDISRQKVNRVHSSANSQIIHHDLLPDPGRLSRLMISCGLQDVSASDGDEFFIAIGKKMSA